MKARSRPNILMIVAHDLGTHLNCYGVPSVRSPRLDRLAEEGVRLTNHFGTAAYCSPARGSLITGKYTHSNGLMGLVNLGWNLCEENVNLAKSLGQGGYKTYLFGMQHEVKDVGRLGFDHVSDRQGGYSCTRVAPLVCEFLKKEAPGSDRPFYARVGFNEVHRRYDSFPPEGADRVSIPPYLKDTPGLRKDLAMFEGAIEQLDRSVGEILDALEESGLSKDTFVVFTTDHGIAFPRAKATVYDSGIRTACLLRWPGGFEGGQVLGSLLSSIDLFPTFHEAAGVNLPGGVQGRSYFSLLRGEPYPANEAIFAGKNSTPGDIKRCIRTCRFKYIRNFDRGPVLALPTGIETSYTRADMGHEHLAPRPPTELYDVENDPNETNNLSGVPEWNEVEAELSARLELLMEETEDPILKGTIPRPPEEADLLARAWAKAEELAREAGQKR